MGDYARVGTLDDEEDYDLPDDVQALADSVMGRPAPPPPPSPPGTPDQLHWSASIELPEETGVVSERGS
eukprot:CAMPEP_0119497876 /NCGR_PEP_ID=MMETSP1344-20130328/20795_1 /TAXON_ID=236787 /ORGANISM="Florenciella parvula, Strain CCMP2471" /LENGTH=68 /DNA_ID=CAMNT_0007533703 /DNA_START=106 /DNA_END=309 /DNA_ORIENTATION=+